MGSKVSQPAATLQHKQERIKPPPGKTCFDGCYEGKKWVSFEPPPAPTDTGQALVVYARHNSTDIPEEVTVEVRLKQLPASAGFHMAVEEPNNTTSMMASSTVELLERLRVIGSPVRVAWKTWDALLEEEWISIGGYIPNVVHASMEVWE